jgi:hypothetical protein
LGWWHRHQTEWLNHEADAIRNGLLQDLFAMRRKLELLNEDCNACLADVEHLYAALENLGNRLSSPFIHESLPLAIQHVLSPWQGQLPIKVDLPAQWSVEPAEHIMLLLSVVDYLLNRLGKLTPSPQQITVSLAATAEEKQLLLHIEFDSAVPPALLEICDVDDWHYRLQMFQVLTHGTCHCQQVANTLTWQLCWQPDSSCQAIV